MNNLEFLEKAHKSHGYKYQYPDLPNKVRLTDKIVVEYDGIKYYQTIKKHLDGKSPEKKIVKKTTAEFIRDSKNIWGEKYDYSLTEYTGSLDRVKIVYNGVTYDQRASSHLNGLAPEFRKNDEFLLKEIYQEEDWVGNKEIINFLKKYKIEYQYNYQRDGIKFNFYLPHIRTIVQYDGIHHFEVSERFGGYESYLNIIENDLLIEKYCEEEYINLIRIRYDQIDDIYCILYDSLKNYIK